mgnify:CR=1 FL=1
MAYENNNKSFDEKRNTESIFSKRIKAGKRRTYFFDVRETRGSDYFITITESKKRFNDDGYDRHKMFIYKEDFNKFLTALTETVDYVKTDLMPDFDFDAFNHDDYDENREYTPAAVAETAAPVAVEAVAEPVEALVEEAPVVEASHITSSNDDTDVDAWKI